MKCRRQSWKLNIEFLARQEAVSFSPFTDLIAFKEFHNTHVWLTLCRCAAQQGCFIHRGCSPSAQAVGLDVSLWLRSASSASAAILISWKIVRTAIQANKLKK